MKNLPVPVSDDDIEAMFSAVDRNGDEQLSYREFKMMVNPPDIPQVLSTHYLHNIYTLSTHIHTYYLHLYQAARPHVSQLGLQPQVFSPPPGASILQ